jgi:hypothetical protein
MLALGKLERPLFPLYHVEIRSLPIPMSLIRRTREVDIMSSKMTPPLSEECWQILSEIRQLTNEFDHLSTRVSCAQELDDIEYRCVLVQFRLLNYDYAALEAFTQLINPSVDVWDQVFQGCYRLTLLIYFGKSSISHAHNSLL